jgi:hypothetical protein
MWYSTTDGQYIYEGNQFTIGGIEYPANWLNLSTPEEKSAIGLEEVIPTNQPGNSEYYWVTPEFNGASLTYINTPKDLITIKTNSLSQINNTAYSILFPSDWMVIKSVETSTPINADWNSWRASIRATADSTRTAVTAAQDVDAVVAIMSNIQWAKSPSALTEEAAQVIEETA